MIEIPDGVNVAIHETKLTITGKNGEVSRKISPLVTVLISGKSIDIQQQPQWARLQKCVLGVANVDLKEISKDAALL